MHDEWQKGNSRSLKGVCSLCMGFSALYAFHRGQAWSDGFVILQLVNLNALWLLIVCFFCIIPLYLECIHYWHFILITYMKISNHPIRLALACILACPIAVLQLHAKHSNVQCFYTVYLRSFLYDVISTSNFSAICLLEYGIQFDMTCFVFHRIWLQLLVWFLRSSMERRNDQG